MHIFHKLKKIFSVRKKWQRYMRYLPIMSLISNFFRELESHNKKSYMTTYCIRVRINVVRVLINESRITSQSFKLYLRKLWQTLFGSICNSATN